MRNKLDIIVIILGGSHVFPAKLKDGQKGECDSCFTSARAQTPKGIRSYLRPYLHLVCI